MSQKRFAHAVWIIALTFTSSCMAPVRLEFQSKQQTTDPSVDHDSIHPSLSTASTPSPSRSTSPNPRITPTPNPPVNPSPPSASRPEGLRYTLDNAVFQIGKPIPRATPQVANCASCTFSISSLPSGLQINSSTGVISGTPTQPMSTTVYLVMARNALGSSFTSISFRIVSAATILEPRTATNSLGVGGILSKGRSLTSTNGRYRLILQSDSNLCIYDNGQFKWGSFSLIASSLSLTAEGRVELFSACSAGQDKVIEAFTEPVSSPSHLQLLNDGRLVLVNQSGEEVWNLSQGLFNMANLQHFYFQPALHPDPSKRTSSIARPSSAFGIYYQKYLNSHGVHILGTASVSDAAMRIVKAQYDQILGSLTQESAAALQAYQTRPVLDSMIVFLMSQYDFPSQMQFFYPNAHTSEQSACDHIAWLKNTIDRGWRGFGGTQALITEEMICRKGITTQPSDTAYRSLDQAVHEFAHALDGVLGLWNSYSQLSLQEPPHPHAWAGPPECWAISVQSWFSQNYSYHSQGNQGVTFVRDHLKVSPAYYNYMKTVFQDQNGYTPIRCSDYFP